MPYTRKNSSRNNIPLRRSSPRLLARTRKAIPTSHSQAVSLSSSARHTKAASKEVAGSKHKSTVEPNNLRKINQGRGDSNGVDNQIPTKKGLISGRYSLQKEFDKEQQSGGSETDSFVSTLGDLKDIDIKGSDNEGGSVEQVTTKSKGKDTADDDASSRKNDEDNDLSSFNFNAAENMEESAGMELSPALLPRRESIESDRPTSNRQPPVNRVGNVGSSVVVSSGRKTQRANNYTEKENRYVVLYASMRKIKGQQLFVLINESCIFAKVTLS
jgi:hypothetical protein